MKQNNFLLLSLLLTAHAFGASGGQWPQDSINQQQVAAPWICPACGIRIPDFDDVLDHYLVCGTSIPEPQALFDHNQYAQEEPLPLLEPIPANNFSGTNSEKCPDISQEQPIAPLQTPSIRDDAVPWLQPDVTQLPQQADYTFWMCPNCTMVDYEHSHVCQLQELLPWPTQALTTTTAQNLSLEATDNSATAAHQHPYQCKQCEKAFKNNTDLRRHERTHTGEKSYQCDICNKSFIQSAHLIQHKRIHTGGKLYYCNHCNETFTQAGARNRHVQRHSGEKSFQCSICQKFFTRKSTLTNHLADKHGMVLAQVLPVTIPSPESLSAAIAPATSSAAYIPLQASTPYDDRDDDEPIRPRRSFPEAVQHMCTYQNCTKTYPTEKQLTAHVNWHNIPKHTCTTCDATFISKKQQQKHMRAQHRKKKQQHVLPDTATPTSPAHIPALAPATTHQYTCKMCGDSFSSKTYYDDHFPLCTESVQNRTQPPALVNDPYSQNIEAGNTITGDDSMDSDHEGNRLELLENSLPTITPAAACPAQLINAQLPSSVETSTQQTGQMSDTMQQHMPPVASANPYKSAVFQCPECPMYFFEKYHLTVHIRTHTKEKPYKCRFCDYAASTSGNRNTHEKRMHFEEKFLSRLGASTTLCTVPAPLPTPTIQEAVHVADGNSLALLCNTALNSNTEIESDDASAAANALLTLQKQQTQQDSLVAQHAQQQLPSNTHEKKYTCSYCDKYFSAIHKCKEHERTHTGEKPHACHYCTLRFTTASNKKRHEKKYCPNRPTDNLSARGADEAE